MYRTTLLSFVFGDRVETHSMPVSNVSIDSPSPSRDPILGRPRMFPEPEETHIRIEASYEELMKILHPCALHGHKWVQVTGTSNITSAQKGKTTVHSTTFKAERCSYCSAIRNVCQHKDGWERTSNDDPFLGYNEPFWRQAHI